MFITNKSDDVSGNNKIILPNVVNHFWLFQTIYQELQT